jgi:hypothetical protein
MFTNPLSAMLALALFSIITSCQTLKNGESGIMGAVTWIEGNQMPMILEDGQNPPKKESKPIQRKIQVYPLMKISDLKMEDGLFVAVMEKPIAEVESNRKGKFRIALAPGKYSVFTVEEGGLFANIFDGDGNVNPVTVKENEWISIEIEVNYRAVY